METGECIKDRSDQQILIGVSIFVGCILVVIGVISYCVRRQGNLDNSLYAEIKGQSMSQSQTTNNPHPPKVEDDQNDLSLSSEILLNRNF